jgi:hypothetical protein
LVLTATLILAPVSTVKAQAFTDIAFDAGVQFHQESELLAPIGGGAAWVDVNNDGFDDLFAAQATGCNRLFLNDGAANFSEVSLAPDADDCTGISHGVGAADIDNDGDQDVFVTNNGQNRLYKNLFVESGLVEFEDITLSAGLDNDGAFNSSSVVFGDFNKDGLLDMFVGNHREFEEPELTCNPDYLWQNNGDGTFTNIAGPTGVGMSGDYNQAGCALAATWSDFDKDGDQDLFVVNDFGLANGVPDRLFRNDGSDGLGGWTFTDISDTSGFNFVQAGMGIAVGDLNRDGNLDYYCSDLGPNELALSNGDGTFTESAAAAGVTAHDPDLYGGIDGLVSWGNGFFDLDNDGWEDLIVANGGAPREKWPAGMFGGDYVDNNPPYIYRNLRNGTFRENHEVLGFAANEYFRGAAFSDVDQDGDIDIYFGNLQGNNYLYRNNFTNENAALKVRARGTLGNRDSVGAKIEAVINPDLTLQREISGGNSFLSRNSLVVHFGLRNVQTLRLLRATWLSGVTNEVLNVAVNSTVNMVEPLVTTVMVDDDDRLDVVAGDPIPVDLEIDNHTPQARAIQLWMVHVKPNGVENVLFGPFDLNVPADGGFSPSINVPTDPTLVAGEHVLVTRMGTFPDTITHQDHLFLDVTAP